MSESLFRPVDAPWQGVDPKLTTALRIVTVAPQALVVVVLALLAGVLPVPTLVRAILGLVALVVLATAVWTWFWAQRYRRSIGYAEQDDDLLVTTGVMFKRLVAVPYGRMQFVDVAADPVERWLGIASVTLHTASTETAARIQGLPADEARRLRDRLTEVGEADGAGV